MSRLHAAKGLDESPRPRTISTRLLASACYCAQRLQVSLEDLGAASTVLVLTGVGTNFVVSYLSGLIINSGLRPNSNEISRDADCGLADSKPIEADFP
jgi:hypothetical protein